METRIFLFYNLKPGIDRDAFEKRAREVEALLAADAPAIVSYTLTRLEGVVEGNEPSPYDYVETMQVTTIPEYQAVGASSDVQAFLRDWEEDVASYVIVHGVVVSRT